MIDLANAADVKRALKNLEVDFLKYPASFQKKWIRQALKNAVKDTNLVPKFRGAAPLRTGALRKSPTIVTGNIRSGKGKGNPYARVGYGRSKARPGHHAILVHSGTKDRYTKSGAYRGKMPANPAAMDAVLNYAELLGTKSLQRELVDAMEKANKQWNSPKYQARMAAWKAKRGIR